jgi:TonB family protein
MLINSTKANKSLKMILNFQNLMSFLLGMLVVSNFTANAQPDGKNIPLQDTLQSGQKIISVSGTVTQRDGKPLQNVLVRFGTNSYEMTSSDVSGNFHFELIPSNAMLWFDCIGKKSVLHKVDENQPMKIIMENDTLKLGVLTVSSVDLLHHVSESRSNDVPNQPLFFLDEVQISRSEMDSLDYKSVESFIIMKDQQAIDLYGEKGRNGVIRMVSRSVEDQKRLAEQIEHTFSDGLIEPRFPDGEMALRDLINRELKYPDEALKEKIQGKVFVTFRISLIGKVENAKIVRSVHPLLDKEAIRIVSNLPDWEPGQLYGKPWSTSYTIPIKFSLPDPVTLCNDTLSLAPSKNLPNHFPQLSNLERQRLWIERQKEKDLPQIALELPEFPGGEEGFRRYILSEIRKSELGIKEKVQGNMLVSFVVNGNGGAERVNIIHSLHPILDEVVLRIIRTTPYWKPGNQLYNRKMEVIYILPIRFVIN